MRRLGILLSASVFCVALAFPASLRAQYTYVGAAGGDFFDALNWEDGGGLNPAFIDDPNTGKVDLDLIVNGSSVVAGAEVDFGIGSLSLSSGAMLDVTTGRMDFDSGSTLTMNASTLNVLNNTSSQFDMNSGSTLSMIDSFLTATDDIFFRGNTTIMGSEVTSNADDIEFQDTAVLTAIADSDFETLDIVQIVAFQSPGTITNSTFTTGRLSLETPADITAIDSDFNLNGDIDDAFNTVSFATLTLAGTTTLRADQLDEGITVVLQDSASMSLIDDNQEGEWITGSSVPGVVSKIVFESADASLTFTGPQDPTDDATQVFHNLVGNMQAYSTHPHLFNPDNWDGQSDVTITIALIPEPATLMFGSMLLGFGLAKRRPRAA